MTPGERIWKREIDEMPTPEFKKGPDSTEAKRSKGGADKSQIAVPSDNPFI
jgi:hypothetical protein